MATTQAVLHRDPGGVVCRKICESDGACEGTWKSKCEGEQLVCAEVHLCGRLGGETSELGLVKSQSSR